MARTKNIFDYASKELSATAFWAWILDAELSDDASLAPVTADLRLKLNIPSDAVLESVGLEKNPDDPNLGPAITLEIDQSNDRKRIDILARYRLPDGDLLHLVIENKVRRDAGVIEQVTGYCDRLQRRVNGSVQAAVFTFEKALASSALATERGISVVTLPDMVALIDKHASVNALLAAYASFLKDKLTVANASPVRGPGDNFPENLARWSVVADQIGIRDLLETYVSCAEKHGFVVMHSKVRSIYLTLGNRSPVVSVHPSKSSANRGLWFGVSITNLLRVHNLAFSRSHMPHDFAWQVENQGTNEWRFGFLSNNSIDPVLRKISGTNIV